jgi:serine/threonine-protein kinase
MLAFALGLTLVAGLVGYLFAAIVLFPAPIFATATTVPRVMGQDVGSARTTLREAGLAIGEVETVQHPAALRGRVVWQDPPPEVAVPEGTPVTLEVSAGPQRVPVPDLTGYDADVGRRLLEAAGLAIGRFDSTQAPLKRGVIVNTRPPAGAVLLPGSRVTLVVSAGAPTITVPNLVGLTRDEAREVLEQAGLALGTWIFRTSNTAEPGTILDQDPAANTLSAPGAAVNVTVARRRRP